MKEKLTRETIAMRIAKEIPKGNLLQALFALGELMQSGQKSFTEGYKPGMRLR